MLFGQPELDVMLEHESLRQLRQRITFSCRLPELDKDGTRDYVNHRLVTAGYNGAQLFEDTSLGLLHRVSGGVPRLINVICHKALMSAYGKGDRQVAKHHLASAVNDTEGVSMPTTWQPYLWGLSVVAVIATLSLFFVVPGGL